MNETVTYITLKLAVAGCPRCPICGEILAQHNAALVAGFAVCAHDAQPLAVQWHTMLAAARNPNLLRCWTWTNGLIFWTPSTEHTHENTALRALAALPGWQGLTLDGYEITHSPNDGILGDSFLNLASLLREKRDFDRTPGAHNVV